jgi:hypothetical protein
MFSVYVNNVRKEGDKVYLIHSVEINSVLHSTQWYSCEYNSFFSGKTVFIRVYSSHGDVAEIFLPALYFIYMYISIVLYRS